ncbi:MAG TPA: hypothetical protein VN258_03540 [Mobilitalea sp.]|nr:hypothetical protein [Mobilitalea sp.]
MMEVIYIDPNWTVATGQTVFSSQPFGNNVFLASVFTNMDEQNNYLASLDSDTRDYVLKHTDEYRSQQDIIDCVNRLRTGS